MYSKKTTLDKVKRWRKRNKIVNAIGRWFEEPEETKCFDIAFFSSITPIYLIIFLLSSVAALVFSGYFYCLCLPYIFIKINVIQTILKALGGRAKQLFFVVLLILSILFIYTIISFVFMYNFFDRSKDLFCESTGECFVTVVREGLFNSFSTIPVKYTGQTQPSFEIYVLRALVDISFFVIIIVISLNVIVAVLVDRFSELREEKEKALQDSKDFCFVCGIKSDYFERQDPDKGFTYHYRKEHNMYHYMYYYLHLQSIHPLDQNAVQRYVSKCMNENSTKFIPLQRAKFFGGKVPSEAIQESQASILAELKEISEKLQKTEDAN